VLPKHLRGGRLVPAQFFSKLWQQPAEREESARQAAGVDKIELA
jgi:hypothetical protein